MAEAARRPAGMLATVALGRALRRAAREEARTADLIHAHWWIPGGLAAPPEVPLVLTVHGTDGVLLQQSRVAGFLAKSLFRRARVVTAVSESAAQAITAVTGRNVNAAHIQPMPVEIARYDRPSRGGGGLVAVARLTRQKRIDLALRAVPLLANPSVPLTILGDGAERTALEGLARELGIVHRVRFLGAVPPIGVAEHLATADAALFPAVGEGFGLAAAEALMAGVPVVACEDGGGVLSIVPAAGAGRRVPPQPASIAKAVDELLADPGSHAAAEREGRHWRERLGPDHVAAVCEGWYHEALGV
jgi:glycosyltransferase involved in cell wall biosynthesis